ncbi:MAG: aspartate aminotransferase family protein [Bryobacterales bacterium]|nr:aspartate aminotransferase family protein [Bryobacterales bacterium]
MASDHEHHPLAPPQSEGDVNLSSRRAAWQQKHLSAATRQQLAEDARYYLHQSLSTPCLNVLAKAEGSWIEDTEGRRFLDFHGNNVHHLGFGHPAVMEAVTRQMATLPFCTRRYTCEPAIALARKLATLAPGDLSRVLLAPGGTSAMGIAMKLARAATGRYKTISLWDAFHGASLDAASIGGERLFRDRMGPLLPGALHAPPPEPQNCPFHCGTQCSLQCAGMVDYLMEKEGEIGAVVVETVRSTSAIPPAGYLRHLREACNRHGAMLIFDEIPHGLGRTGRLFTFEHFGVQPDIVVLGKALGGGIFPLAAVIARESLNVAEDLALGHYTHEKNPVACAAALAVLETIEAQGFLERVCTLGENTAVELRSLAARCPLIADVRALGLLLCVVLRHPATGEPACDAAERIMYRCLELGLSFKVSMGNVLTLTPPLTITDEEMRFALNAITVAVSEECRAPAL